MSELSRRFKKLSRAEKVEVIREMYDGPFGTTTLVEIGSELGITGKYVSDLLNDPDRSKIKRRRAKMAGVCEDCGGPTSGTASGHAKMPKVCISCSRVRQSAKKKWTRERIIACIQEWNELNGRPPLADEWLHQVEGSDGTRGSRRWPAVSAIQKEFGSWSNAIEAAGFERRIPHMLTAEWKEWREGNQPEKWTRQRIIEAAQEYYRKYGRQPTSYNWRPASEEHPTSSVVSRKFGGWPQMRREAGLPEHGTGRQRKKLYKPKAQPRVFEPCTCPACVAERS